MPRSRSVIGRAVVVLDTLAESDETTVAELVRRVGLPKSTVHRMVSDLVRHGLLDRTGGEVSLGVYLFELGCRVPVHRRLRQAGLPFMEDLYETTHEIVQLGVLDGSDVLYIVQINGHNHPLLPTGDGVRVPAHATALGKALLAFSPRAAVVPFLQGPLRPMTPYTIVVPGVLMQDLARTCRHGMAVEREETALGTASVAAPIFGSGHRVLAALSVTGRSCYFEPERLAQAVRVAAAGISRQLKAGPRRGWHESTEWRRGRHTPPPV